MISPLEKTLSRPSVVIWRRFRKQWAVTKREDSHLGPESVCLSVFLSICLSVCPGPPMGVCSLYVLPWGSVLHRRVRSTGKSERLINRALTSYEWLRKVPPLLKDLMSHCKSPCKSTKGWILGGTSLQTAPTKPHSGKSTIVFPSSPRELPFLVYCFMLTSLRTRGGRTTLVQCLHLTTPPLCERVKLCNPTCFSQTKEAQQRLLLDGP